jgi:hypothetical protein
VCSEKAMIAASDGAASSRTHSSGPTPSVLQSHHELLACIGEEEKQWGEEVRRGSNDMKGRTAGMIGDDMIRRTLQ